MALRNSGLFYYSKLLNVAEQQVRFIGHGMGTTGREKKEYDLFRF